MIYITIQSINFILLNPTFNQDNYFISTNFMYIYRVLILINLKNRIFLKEIKINSEEKYKISNTKKNTKS